MESLCKRRGPNKGRSPPGAYFLVGRRVPPGERVLTFTLQGAAQHDLNAAGDRVTRAVLRFILVE